MEVSFHHKETKQQREFSLLSLVTLSFLILGKNGERPRRADTDERGNGIPSDAFGRPRKRKFKTCRAHQLPPQ
jgi:hypothetical protein